MTGTGASQRWVTTVERSDDGINWTSMILATVVQGAPTRRQRDSRRAPTSALRCRRLADRLEVGATESRRSLSRWIAAPAKDNATTTRLWDAADQLRANSGLKSQGYSGPILGLIFLRFADVRFANAFEHVYESYPERNEGVYAQVA